jgi:hypothetical protein
VDTGPDRVAVERLMRVDAATGLCVASSQSASPPVVGVSMLIGLTIESASLRIQRTSTYLAAGTGDLLSRLRWL